MNQGVWAEVVGQPEAVATLQAAVAGSVGNGPSAAMTHAWLFTGPPGSGRSVAARAFAAGLHCVHSRPQQSGFEGGSQTGCGECAACRTAMAGTHADVQLVEPEGLSISVTEMRALVQSAARAPSTGRWRILLIADADRLTEGAANALLKAVEEPPERTVFLLCAPSDHPEDVPVTIRSRCRVLRLRAPLADDIAQVLIERDGVAEDQARWAASVCSGHIGRARRLATDPEARSRRDSVLSIPLGLRGFADVFTAAEGLVKTAEAEASASTAELDAAESEQLHTAMGGGGSGKGTATATRGANAAIRELEKRQKSRTTRRQRDSLDLALIDLTGFYRDVLIVRSGSGSPLNHPDYAREISQAAGDWTAESVLRRLEAVLECRRALTQNVKPTIALEALMATLQRG